MKLASIKAVIAAVWVSGAYIAGVAGNLRSPWAWLGLSAVAVVPPLVMMWQWNDPAKTMSESINEARR